MYKELTMKELTDLSGDDYNTENYEYVKTNGEFGFSPATLGDWDNVVKLPTSHRNYDYFLVFDYRDSNALLVRVKK